MRSAEHPDGTPAPSRITPPRRSPEAVASARQKALEARRTRAEVKQRVRSGATSPSDVLDLAFTDTELGRAVARMTVGDLLLSLPGTGHVLADRTLVQLGISGERRLRALGEHQRAALRATWGGSRSLDPGRGPVAGAAE